MTMRLVTSLPPKVLLACAAVVFPQAAVATAKGSQSPKLPSFAKSAARAGR